MGEKVNASELARRLGVTEGAIRKAKRVGRIKANANGLYDVEDCKTTWEASRDPDAAIRGALGGAAVANDPAKVSGGMSDNSLTRARTAQAVLKIKREQLALARESGELISKADALRACLAVVTVVNERIDGAAAQIGPRVVGLDAAGAERVAREILNGVRSEIAAMSGAVDAVGENKSAA